MRDPIDVWLYGTRMASIVESRHGRLELTWDSDALDRWGPGARLLSAKMTVGDRPVAALVKNYLDGLLPEGNARVNHALSAGVPPDDTFALVRAYGRDSPGAAIFVTEGAGDPTRAGRYEPLTPGDVADRLRRADEHSPATHDGLVGESSTLPGMVPKITLHRDGDAWFSCKDGAASTWIIKRASAAGTGITDVVDTEVACLDLARRIGLTTVSAEIFDHAGVRGIAVSRYDRAPSAESPRLHQEDLAQATGLNTQDPNRKFQWGSQMPSLKHAADILRLDGANPDSLLRLATFSYLVGNTDMHAKNISFMRHSDGSVALSPAYDIAMHLHHDRDNRRSALDLNHKFLMNDITIDDVIAEGTAWGIPERRAHRVVTSTAEDLATALQEIDRGDHPGVPPRAWDLVEERTYEAAEPITRSLAARSVESQRSPLGGSEVVHSHGSSGRPVQSYTRKRRGPRRPK
ncbi:type II toxin-antitoxin system HipA family toxin [Nocardioides sp. GXZ039]|uniref:type II toxin-antitoxin system HipA family toxin n=1 Tax=Nocardioides sp. GXZ039 TaxID=3136018 RepID=UPI0030F390D2